MELTMFSREISNKNAVNYSPFHTTLQCLALFVQMKMKPQKPINPPPSKNTLGWVFAKPGFFWSLKFSDHLLLLSSFNESFPLVVSTVASVNLQIVSGLHKNRCFLLLILDHADDRSNNRDGPDQSVLHGLHTGMFHLPVVRWRHAAETGPEAAKHVDGSDHLLLPGHHG